MESRQILLPELVEPATRMWVILTMFPTTFRPSTSCPTANMRLPGFALMYSSDCMTALRPTVARLELGTSIEMAPASELE